MIDDADILKPDEPQDDTPETNDGSDEGQILVVTGEDNRAFGARKLSVEQLSENVSRFLSQMGSVLEHAPAEIGGFQFVEFEVNAEINAKGALALLGTGGEAGASGGIKFVFRRPAPENK
jgi:hypothetical protein